MKLSEIKNERAIEVLADLIAPAREVFGDAKVVELIKTDKLGAVQFALKGHPKAVMEILALTEGVPVEEFECNVLTLPMKLLEIFTDPDLMGFLLSEVPGKGTQFFGNAMESTEEETPSEDSSSIS